MNGMLLKAATAVLLTLAIVDASWAGDCTTATMGPKPEGYIFYNSSAKTIQFCNGTEWVAARGTQGPPGPTGPAGDVPSGAVMAFDLTSCPPGWSEYLPAKGRFVRGVCLDTTGCNDSDGVRTVGSTQTDAIRNITGEIDGIWGSSETATGAFSLTQHAGVRGAGNTAQETKFVFNADNVVPTADENRPVNVALLYCRKD